MKIIWMMEGVIMSKIEWIFYIILGVLLIFMLISLLEQRQIESMIIDYCRGV